ncbi:DUF309 domain-containing protein [Candidatus Poribacteria bacterium]|nr:DUF309 domain-containing protein [Candidatus Poribacteria bacterium]
MEKFAQPIPFDLSWCRYCPEALFPAYRHIPGQTPHPLRDPNGHSYGFDENVEDANLTPDMWRQNTSYLYGVDLFNFAYWWEAHEAWEGLWHQAEDTYRLFLQGLIQISASLIKYHMRMLRPLRTLSTAGRDKLQKVLIECGEIEEIFMGINLTAFLEVLDTFYSPFFSDSVTEETYQKINVKPLIQLRI